MSQIGVEATETDFPATVAILEQDIQLPDLPTELQERTQLTRRTIRRVMLESGDIEDFVQNPQEQVRLAAEAINRWKMLPLIDGIGHQRLDDGEYYAQELLNHGVPQQPALHAQVVT